MGTPLQSPPAFLPSHLVNRQQAAMKYTLIASIVMLALAQGSLAADPAMEDLTKIFQTLSAQFESSMQSMKDSLQSQTMLQDVQTQVEPLMTQMKESIVPLQEKIAPLGEELKAQLQPMIETFQTQIDAQVKALMDQLALKN